MNINPFQVGDVLATKPEPSLVLKKEDNSLLLKMGDQHIWALGVDMDLNEDEEWKIVWERAFYFDDIAIVPDIKELTQYDNCTAVLSNSLWYVIGEQNCALLLTSSFAPDELPGDDAVVVPPFFSWNNRRYEVTGVADWAFYKNEQILNLKLPFSVTKIGKYAFAESQLKTISFSENTYLTENSFYSCKDLVINRLNLEEVAMSGNKKSTVDSFNNLIQKVDVLVDELNINTLINDVAAFKNEMASSKGGLIETVEMRTHILGNNKLTNSSNSLLVSYKGKVVEVDNLKEGMLLADEWTCSEGGDINIYKGEDTIAYREWFPFDDSMDDDFAVSDEKNPIIFEGIGFYSDWIIDSDLEQALQFDPPILENQIKKGDTLKSAASEKTIVLDVSGDNALLFTGTQFIEANHCYLDEKGLQWNFGKYYENFSDIPASEYKTFGEFLNSGVELDCELIIGDEEMDMSFVWNTTDRITHYGYKQFQDLLDCPYECLPNGNISIDDGDAEQGNLFVSAAAGYISQSESLKMFTEVSEPEVDWEGLKDHEM